MDAEAAQHVRLERAFERSYVQLIGLYYFVASSGLSVYLQSNSRLYYLFLGGLTDFNGVNWFIWVFIFYMGWCGIVVAAGEWRVDEPRSGREEGLLPRLSPRAVSYEGLSLYARRSAHRLRADVHHFARSDAGRSPHRLLLRQLLQSVDGAGRLLGARQHAEDLRESRLQRGLEDPLRVCRRTPRTTGSLCSD